MKKKKAAYDPKFTAKLWRLQSRLIEDSSVRIQWWKVQRVLVKLLHICCVFVGRCSLERWFCIQCHQLVHVLFQCHGCSPYLCFVLHLSWKINTLLDVIIEAFLQRQPCFEGQVWDCWDWRGLWRRFRPLWCTLGRLWGNTRLEGQNRRSRRSWDIESCFLRTTATQSCTF